MNNQQLVDSELGTPPPSTVDVDAVVRGQRRRVRLQQAGIGVSAGAMTVAIVLILTLLPRTSSPPSTTVGAPSDPATTDAPTAREEEAARLTHELTALLQAALPQAEFLPYSAVVAADPLAFVDRGDYFEAAAQIRDASGTGSIRVEIGAAPDPGTCPSDPRPQDLTSLECDTSPGPGGSTVKVLTASRDTYQWNMVTVTLGPDEKVSIIVSNGVDVPEYQTGRPTPPLDAAQVTDLAVSPGLVPQP